MDGGTVTDDPETNDMDRGWMEGQWMDNDTGGPGQWIKYRIWTTWTRTVDMVSGVVCRVVSWTVDGGSGASGSSHRWTVDGGRWIRTRYRYRTRSRWTRWTVTPADGGSWPDHGRIMDGWWTRWTDPVDGPGPGLYRLSTIDDMGPTIGIPSPGSHLKFRIPL